MAKALPEVTTAPADFICQFSDRSTAVATFQLFPGPLDFRTDAPHSGTEPAHNERLDQGKAVVPIGGI